MTASPATSVYCCWSGFFLADSCDGKNSECCSSTSSCILHHPSNAFNCIAGKAPKVQVPISGAMSNPPPPPENKDAKTTGESPSVDPAGKEEFHETHKEEKESEEESEEESESEDEDNSEEGGEDDGSDDEEEEAVVEKVSFLIIVVVVLLLCLYYN